MSELRYDPLRLRWTILATERNLRPNALGSKKKKEDEKKEKDPCPFCEGAENETPPEILAVGRKASTPNGPGWQVRVVTNKFPALRMGEKFQEEDTGLYSLAA